MSFPLSIKQKYGNDPFDVSHYFDIEDEVKSTHGQGYKAKDKVNGTKMFITIFNQKLDFPDYNRMLIDYIVKIPSRISKLPGFVHLIDYYFSVEKNREKGWLITAYEQLENGSLDKIFNRLRDKIKIPKFLNATVRSKLVFGIAAAMKSLHRMDIPFGFLCLSNVFLDKDYECRIRFSPSDTTFAMFQIDKDFISSDFYFLSPELCSLSSNIEKPADVFSYGAILFALFEGEFPKLYDIQLLYNGAFLKKPAKISDQYWKLILKCMNNNPELRPTFDEIVSELRDDKFIYEEGTDMDALHEYQNRVDLPELKEAHEMIQRLTKEVEQLKKQLDSKA